MSMLDIHSTALENINEAHHHFLLKFNKCRKSVFGFVEGRDDPSFYRGVIERFIPDDWTVELVLAGNRDKVLEAETMFDWTAFSRQQIAFFIDRDLSEFVGAPALAAENIYITDGYSIENSIVSHDVLVRILSEVHNIVDWTEDERNNIISHFRSELYTFVDLMAPLMSQIVDWRRRQVRANLNNLDLPSLFSFESGRLVHRSEYNSPEQRIARLCECVAAPASEQAVIDEIEEAFRLVDGPSRLTRGKYLIWFLASIANDIHACAPAFVASYRLPPKSKMAFGAKNIMVVAAPRARIPTSLRSFIESTFLQFIAAFAT